jgi:hypothetical protein
MHKVLTKEEVEGFHSNGYLFPFDLYTREEALALQKRYAETEAAAGDELQKRYRVKAQLPFPWLCDIVQNPRLLDAVEDLIGPDILCWGTSFFSKKAHDPRYVSWHTDSFYYGFDPPGTLSAWVSFNDSTIESGCVQYIPGTHKGPLAVHAFRPHPNNLVGNGQTVVDVDESKAVNAVLRAGQVVFHHESIVHGSGPNNADHPRIGFVIHYIAPNVRETRFPDATAMLLRGEDRYGYWGRDPAPKCDFDPDCIRAMDASRALFKAAASRKAEAGILS